MKLSAIVLTRNEEDDIERCLTSLKFCDEIVVIDDFSTDKTVEIAKKFDAQIYEHHLDTNFAAQRNYGAEKATGDWLFFVDADEVVTDELMKEIVVMLMNNNTSHSAYYVKRCDYLFGKKVERGELATTHQKGLIRFMQKGAGRWEGEVHEVFIAHKSVGKLENCIQHFPHPTLSHFIKKINYYSSIRANMLFKKKAHTNLLQIITYPFFKFVYTYFLKFGFLDGPEGFIYSFLMSFHSFLVRAKLHLLWYKK